MNINPYSFLINEVSFINLSPLILLRQMYKKIFLQNNTPNKK